MRWVFKGCLVCSFVVCFSTAFAGDEYIDALREGDVWKIRELVNNVADPTIEVGGRSALTFASWGDCELLRLLKKRGVDLDQPDSQGRTPLLNYVFFGNDICGLQVLVEAGVNIKAKDPRGETALHLALATCSPEKVAFLLQNGADVNAENVAGVSPIMFTRALPPGVTESLEKNGAKWVTQGVKKKILQTSAELITLELAVAREAIEFGRVNSDVVNFKMLRPFLGEEYGESELLRSGGRDPFGNHYTFSTVESSPTIHEATIKAVKDSGEAIPESWKPFLP
jgi:hypothetical protein